MGIQRLLSTSLRHEEKIDGEKTKKQNNLLVSVKLTTEMFSFPDFLVVLVFFLASTELCSLIETVLSSVALLSVRSKLDCRFPFRVINKTKSNGGRERAT